MAGMDLVAVLAVSNALAAAEVRYWVGGGWGVDILVARQTRDHRDLDISIDHTGQDRTIAVLAELGYALETDQLPSRAEFAAPGRRWVDVHPVQLDEHGGGRQHDLNGGWFLYPPGCFTTAVIDGHDLPCLTAAQQLTFHTFYEPRPVDLHDIALLNDLLAAGHYDPDSP
jgi:lincosamide nucleotidyltransferase A/C/D/E